MFQSGAAHRDMRVAVRANSPFNRCTYRDVRRQITQMERNATQPIVHRTCTGCGDVTHYDGVDLDQERLAALRRAVCEFCGELDAVIMITDRDPSLSFTLSSLPQLGPRHVPSR